MKKTTLLNNSISAVIAKMGHTDTLTIGDAGLPVPQGVERIDLAVMKGIPAFEDVFSAMLSELQVQKATIASEMRQNNPALYELLTNGFAQNGVTVEEVSHERFKELTKSSVAVVRTGECKPYANIILESGVTF